MAVLGYNIECTDSALSLIEESYNKLHTDTTLTIPGFSYIKQNAFMDVPVSKIRITSDRTYTIPELPYGSSSASFYHDRNSKPVEIEYNFKKENKYFNTLLPKLYVNSKINEFWISDNFSGCMYLITIQIPM
jgi:hypothetical protein